MGLQGRFGYVLMNHPALTKLILSKRDRGHMPHLAKQRKARSSVWKGSSIDQFLSHLEKGQTAAWFPSYTGIQ